MQYNITIVDKKEVEFLSIIDLLTSDLSPPQACLIKF